MGQSSDILNLMKDLIRNDIEYQLKRLRASRAYDGKLKPVKRSGFTSIGNREGLIDALNVDVVTLPDGNMTIAVTFPGKPYWRYVNYGRRGKQQSPTVKYPPIQAISRWISSKGLPQFRDARGRFISSEDRLFLVQRSIGEYGIFPTLFIQEAMEETRDKMVYYLGEYGKTLLEELIQNGTLFRTNRQ